jgi:hypothetical protein
VKSKSALPLLLPSLVLLAAIAGCGGGSYTPPPPPPPPPISVSISTTAGTVGAGGTAQITTQVNNDTSGKGVTWTISPMSGAGTLTNETSTSATYNAPATPPANDVMVTITATSVADPTQSAPVSIDFAAISVSLLASVGSVEACPAPPSCPAGSTATITATVNFDPANKGVDPASWKIVSPSPAVGTLSNRTGTTVTYTAPTTPPPNDVLVIIQATSLSDSTKSNTIQITFAAIAVFVSPPSVLVAEDTATQQFTATVSFDPSGQGVNWTLTQGAPPTPCPNVPPLTCGAISATSSTSGTPITYTAPSAVPPSPTVTLTATSMSDNTRSASSTITVVNPDAALKGQYAFLFNGFDDATGKQVAVAGSFTADGFGNITSGEEDINGPSGVQTSVTFTGTYVVGLDNRGTASISNSLPGNVTYAFSVGSFNAGVATKGRLIEFDDKTGIPGPGTRGSGIMRLQDPTAFTLASVKGSYGFGLSGQDSSGGRLASAGILSADGAGNITSGTEDSNDAGNVTNTANFTGTYTTPDATNGRATGTATYTSPATNFSMYVVSASEAFLMTTDLESTAGLQSGDMLLQASTPYSKTSLNAGSVFYEVGVHSASPTTQANVQIGLFTADGNGGLTIVSDENDGGTITANNTTSALTYSVDGNGRVTITGGAGTSPILYLVDINKAFLLGMDGSVGFGFLEPQSGAPFGLFSLGGGFFFGVAPPAVTASTVSSGLGRAFNGQCGGFFPFPRRVCHILTVTQDSSASNGTLTLGVRSFPNFTVSPNGRTTTGNASVIYLISAKKLVRIDESPGDVAPTVSIFEQ